MKKEPFECGNYYHIFNRGNNKENIFKERDNYRYFLKLVEKYLLDISKVYAYCLMPNHYHFLLKIKDIDQLPSDFINEKKRIHQPFSNMFNAYSKAFNKKYNRTGSLFQEHLHRIKIGTEEYFKQVLIYIHLNPEKHRFVDDFSRYNFSSYRYYFKQNTGIISKEEAITYFEDIENFSYCHQQKKLKIKLIQKIEELDE